MGCFEIKRIRDSYLVFRGGKQTKLFGERSWREATVRKSKTEAPYTEKRRGEERSPEFSFNYESALHFYVCLALTMANPDRQIHVPVTHE